MIHDIYLINNEYNFENSFALFFHEAKSICAVIFADFEQLSCRSTSRIDYLCM